MSDIKPAYERIEPGDIELGEEVTDMEVKRPGGMVVSVRLSAEEARQLQDIARRAGKPLTVVVREALQATITRHAPVAISRSS